MLSEFRKPRRYAGGKALLIAVFLCLSVNQISAMDAKTETCSPLLAVAAEQIPPAAIPAQEEHGLSQEALEVAHVVGFPITNSMVVTWIVAIGLIVFARVATRRMKQVPDGAQNFIEWLAQSLYSFLEGILGRHPAPSPVKAKQLREEYRL